MLSNLRSFSTNTNNTILRHRFKKMTTVLQTRQSFASQNIVAAFSRSLQRCTKPPHALDWTTVCKPSWKNVKPHHRDSFPTWLANCHRWKWSPIFINSNHWLNLLPLFLLMISTLGKPFRLQTASPLTRCTSLFNVNTFSLCYQKALKIAFFLSFFLTAGGRGKWDAGSSSAQGPGNCLPPRRPWPDSDGPGEADSGELHHVSCSSDTSSVV